MRIETSRYYINFLNGMLVRQIVGKGGFTIIHDEGFLLTLSNVALGPSLSRSCPAVLYKLSTSSTIFNLCSADFVRRLRNY